MLDEFLEIVSKYFKVPIDSINRNTKPSDIEGWDSLSYAEFLIHIENKFNIEFDIYQVLNVEDLNDLYKAIEKQK